MSEIDRRSLMKMTGFGLLAAAIPVPVARAEMSGRPRFADDFDGPAGALPDCVKWTADPGPDVIRDGRRGIFLDGNSNLVIRAVREGASYVGGKLACNWQGAVGTTWEARVRLQPLAGPRWPMTGNGNRWDADNRMAGWRGNAEWKQSYPMDVDDQWHTWRCQWNEKRMYLWADYSTGAPPSFDLPARSAPDSRTLPALSLTAPSSGGVYPAQMLVDWVRVW